MDRCIHRNIPVHEVVYPGVGGACVEGSAGVLPVRVLEVTKTAEIVLFLDGHLKEPVR